MPQSQRKKSKTATMSNPPQHLTFFDDSKTLQNCVHDLHNALCDYVQDLSVRQKKPVFHLMAQVAHRPDRCAVFAEGIGLPLGHFSVYRLLKGDTR